MTALAVLQSIITLGQSETVEFKRSTAELRRAGETLCVFLNGEVVADSGRAPPQVGPESVPSAAQVQVLELAGVARSLPDLMAPSGARNEAEFRDQVVALLLKAGLFEMTVPDKPRSSKEQFRTTEAGRAAVFAASRAS